MHEQTLLRPHCGVVLSFKSRGVLTPASTAVNTEDVVTGGLQHSTCVWCLEQAEAGCQGLGRKDWAVGVRWGRSFSLAGGDGGGDAGTAVGAYSTPRSRALENGCDDKFRCALF